VTGISDPLDPRLANYRELLIQLENGQLDSDLAVESIGVGPPDAIGALGESLVSVAATLSARFERERQFSEVSRAIVQGMYLDEVLDHIYESFRPLIPYDRIGCALLEANAAIARARWARSDSRNVQLKVGFSARMASSSLRTVIDTGQPRIINDLVGYLQEHPRSISTKKIVAEGIQSSLTCPLVALGRPVGFLFFSSSEIGRYATLHQETFLRLADLVSLAVEKSRLYDEMARLNADLLQARQILERQATHDGLTGLLNHRAILDEASLFIVDEASNRDPLAPLVAVMMIDIDHFKLINDSYGHPVGDTVLRSVAERLAGAVGERGQVGRYGGEEFLAIARVADAEEAVALAERLRQVVQHDPIGGRSKGISVTVSVGLTMPTADSQDDAREVIERADAALYRAKGSGRNRVVAG
jgi:diguanylate cyclase (GGDEF)-like protein